MVIDFIKKSKIYFLILILLALLFLCINRFLGYYVEMVDMWFISFINNYIVNDGLTVFMKIITHLGGVIVFIIFLMVVFLLVSNKRVGNLMSINLLIAYIFSVIFKNVFRRERPLQMLIEKPFDFSFPSGHTMCSIVFYGFLIYIVSKLIKNVNTRRVVNIILILIMILVPFSRLYLGVHYFSDVVAGAILGFVCLLSFVNYVKIKELI